MDIRYTVGEDGYVCAEVTVLGPYGDYGILTFGTTKSLALLAVKDLLEDPNGTLTKTLKTWGVFEVFTNQLNQKIAEEATSLVDLII